MTSLPLSPPTPQHEDNLRDGGPFARCVRENPEFLKQLEEAAAASKRSAAAPQRGAKRDRDAGSPRRHEGRSGIAAQLSGQSEKLTYRDAVYLAAWAADAAIESSGVQ